jgi:hypothetical protein
MAMNSAKEMPHAAIAGAENRANPSQQYAGEKTLICLIYIVLMIVLAWIVPME